MIDILELPAPLIGFVPKPTVTPVGWPDADKVIAPPNPPATALVIVELPALPRTTETEAGEAERLNPGVTGPESALISAAPLGLPQPVARSYPLVAE